MMALHLSGEHFLLTLLQCHSLSFIDSKQRLSLRNTNQQLKPDIFAAVLRYLLSQSPKLSCYVWLHLLAQTNQERKQARCFQNKINV